jgi:hypothetical protein
VAWRGRLRRWLRRWLRRVRGHPRILVDVDGMAGIPTGSRRHRRLRVGTGEYQPMGPDHTVELSLFWHVIRSGLSRGIPAHRLWEQGRVALASASLPLGPAPRAFCPRFLPFSRIPQHSPGRRGPGARGLFITQLD